MARCINSCGLKVMRIAVHLKAIAAKEIRKFGMLIIVREYNFDKWEALLKAHA